MISFDSLMPDDVQPASFSPFAHFGHLIASCAPVFMGVKPAALVRLEAWEFIKLQALSSICPIKMQPLDILPRNQVFVYIPQLLEGAFRLPGALHVLRSIGYGGSDVEEYVRELVRRIHGAYRKKNLFPHEIGIFLGYPLEDVLGFWLFGGRNAKMEGEWKVYSDIERAKEIQYFHKEAVQTALTASREGYTLEDIAKYFWNGNGG